MSTVRKARSNGPARGVSEAGGPATATTVGTETPIVQPSELRGPPQLVSDGDGTDPGGGVATGSVQAEPGLRPADDVPKHRRRSARLDKPSLEPTERRGGHVVVICSVCGWPSEHSGYLRRRKCRCYGRCGYCKKPMYLTQSVHFTAQGKHHIRCCDGSY